MQRNKKTTLTGGESMKTNWEKLVATAPAHTIPKQDSPAYRILKALAEGEVSEDEIAAIAGKHYRSPLQQLMGERYGWFLIHSTIGEDGEISGRYLDPRHLSEQWGQTHPHERSGALHWRKYHTAKPRRERSERKRL